MGIECEIDGGFQAGYTGVLAIRMLVPAAQAEQARAFLNEQANRSMLERAKPPRIDVKRICVPTDFSPGADYALAYALSLAKMTGAKVHLLHVIESHEDLSRMQSHPDFTSDSVFVTDFLEKLEAGNEAASSSVEPAFWEDVDLVRSLLVGEPDEAICEYAAAEEIDLVVIATHGRSGLLRALMGSVTEKVIRGCPCPVLSVRLNQEGFLEEE